MKVKKLYLISQDANDNYDTFDSAVVVAYSAKLDKMLVPAIGVMKENGQILKT